MKKLQKIVLDGARPGTGPMQFGDDWPGVFIRGDDALGYALALRRAVERLAGVECSSVDVARLADMIELLGSCRVMQS
jgi:hypothetical protein